MKRVIIESPYGGTPDEVERNVAFARACLLDSLKNGEAPIASHLLHTQVLDDKDPEERKVGIEAGLAWYGAADVVAFYLDNGWSKGMRAAMTALCALGRSHTFKPRFLREEFTHDEWREALDQAASTFKGEGMMPGLSLIVVEDGQGELFLEVSYEVKR